MLAEKRFSKILEALAERKSVTVLELTVLIGVSESTIRRDLNALHVMRRLKKVHGGAALPDNPTVTQDDLVSVRSERNWDEKLRIVQYAVSVIKPNDFVYIDAGTTTALLAEHIVECGATFVTNAVLHAKTLAQRGCCTYLIGGFLKPISEAIIGGGALKDLEKYNFTLGFFGTNGITIRNGFSTPDAAEAAVKSQAIKQCKNPFVLADPSKFNVISSVTFAHFQDAKVITTKIEQNEYRKTGNVMEVDRQ